MSGATAWRTDIQALRGWAVLVVVLFHTGLGVMPAGFLGVDMFFVVSGYLITGGVLRERAAGTFRIGRFYRRRIRRLWPAAAVTLALTTLAAALLLTPSAQVRFWPQLTGALTFSTNVALWRQINYFHDSAAREPLLHFWSLAIEEQYYLLLPFTVVALPRRWWVAGVAAVTLASLAAFLWLYPRSPGAAFYLLPTRAWELGVGSLAACLGSGWAARCRRAVPVAAAVLLVLPFVPVTPAGGYGLVLPACIASAVLLLGARALPQGGRWLVWLGDRSYAIYLVHWPPVAFAHAIALGLAPPPAVAVAIALGGIAGGALLHALVERPALRLRLDARWWAVLIAGSAALAALGALAPRIAGTQRPRVDLTGVTGLAGSACDGTRTRFDPACRSGPAPRILLWGDSFSQHLVPGLLATSPYPFAQASKGGCPPLPGIAPLDFQASRAVARGCVAFADSVLAWLARTPGIKVVALSGAYSRYTWPGVAAMRRDGSQATPEPELLAAAQRALVARLHALGKRVVLVAAPPQASFDAGQCQERAAHGLPTIGAPADCAITPATRAADTAWTRALMRRFTAEGTPVIALEPALCAGGICPTAWNRQPLSVEGMHLTRAGSVLAARRLSLGERVWREAR